MPCGLRDRLDLVDIEGLMPHFAVYTRIPQEMVRSSLGGDVYALSEKVDHMPPLKDFYGPFESLNPGVADWKTARILLPSSG